MTDQKTKTGDQTPAKPIVLVGLMGAGKSCVGRRVAETLRVPFIDSDEEIEKAAGCSVSDIFDVYGEPAFRDCERRVIQRLLESGPSIIATGGGAFMDDAVRDTIKRTSLSIWLQADPEVLFRRTKKSKNRPLLKNDDPLGTLQKLAAHRYPVYQNADVTVETGDESLEATVQKVLDAIPNSQTLNSQSGSEK